MLSGIADGVSGLIAPWATAFDGAQPKLCAAVSLICGAAALWRYKSRPHHEWKSNQVPIDEVKSLSFVSEKKEFLFGLSGDQKPKAKMTYNKKDFGDYVGMVVLSWSACGLAYGMQHLFTRFVAVAGVFLVSTFAIRHGVEFVDAPLLVSRPVSSFYHLIKYKIGNMRLGFFAQVALCFGEAALFSSGIIQSLQVYPTLKSGMLGVMSELWVSRCFWFLTVGLFYLHIGVLTVFRLLTFLAHVWDHKHVFEFLSETGWKKVLSFVPRMTTDSNSILFQIEQFVDHVVGLLHALITGIFTHIVTVIPYYFALKLVTFAARSGSAAPAGEFCEMVDPVVGAMFALSWMFRFAFVEGKILQDFEDNELNDWYIRDHWLGHHDRFEFNYMHGPHHDALPIGMIAVADNGPVEGLVRHFLGHFDSFMCPPHAFFQWTKTVVRDLVGHQYVPGVFPFSYMSVDYGVHHVEHHYLSMYPLGNGIEMAPDPRNNCEVENWLSGEMYSADNKNWRWYVGEVIRLEKGFLSEAQKEKFLAWAKGEKGDKKEK